MKRALVSILITTLAILTTASAVVAARPGDTVVEMIVIREEMTFGSGSCSGETVEFTGLYHAVIRMISDAETGSTISYTINDTESNWGTGVGSESGDRYVRIYRSSTSVNYGLVDGDGTVIHTTALTRVVRLGPGGITDDMWATSVIHTTLTPSGAEVTFHHTNDGCF